MGKGSQRPAVILPNNVLSAKGRTFIMIARENHQVVVIVLTV